LRLIAVERAVHAVVFGLFAIALFVVEAHLPAVHAQAQGLLDQLRPALAGSGPSASQAWLTRQLEHLLQLRAGTLRVLLATAIVYCVVEGAEAVGLWRLRRWAEYLTALATAGFLPFEIVELVHRITVVRVGALVVNVAVLIYLVWAKRLFGIRGGASADDESLDAAELFAPHPHRSRLVVDQPT
jgi:uncharacterized membrane protein (DUF2068 family)